MQPPKSDGDPNFESRLVPHRGAPSLGGLSLSASESVIWMVASMHESMLRHEAEHRRREEEARSKIMRRFAAITLFATILGPLSGWYAHFRHTAQQPPVATQKGEPLRQPAETAEYATVQPNDNVCRIARRFGRDAAAIIAENNMPLIQRGEYLDAPCRAGQVLRLPQRGVRGPHRVTCWKA